MPSEPTATIVAERLTKTFSVRHREPGLAGGLRHLLAPPRLTKTAVDQVSFSIEPGEIVAYLGLNGAGKSTTLKLLAGVLVPTSGRVLVLGRQPHLHRTWNARRVSAVFGQRTALWWDLPAIESFKIVKAMYGLSDRTFERRLQAFDGVLGLSEFWATPVRQLSLGQRVRCDLGAALLPDPAVLYLDEPTIGMDIVSKDQVRTFLLQLVRARDVTVVLTTHDLADIEHLCDRALLIDQGRLRYDGTLDELRSRDTTQRLLHIRFTRAVPDPRLEGAERVSLDGTSASFRFPAATNPQSLILRLATEYAVSDISIEEPSFEDVLRAFYERRQEFPA